ncbi:MAG: FAD-binding oxidoreductase [Porticoccaceae bacterium]
MLPAPFIAAVQTLIGSNRLLEESADLQRYGVDRTTVWQPAPSAIALPGTVEEVQQLVVLANQYDVAVVPSGGRTGLSGGAVAKNGELVIAMDRLNEVIEFNPIDRAVTVGAGMITANLQDFAEQQGLYYPVDFASAGSSQIGGNIATNAGGIKVIRYGMTREWVLGLKVVTGSGELLELNRGLLKNNTGYDMRHLFIGSEGTLGLICEATIKLARPPVDLAVLVLGVNDFPSIMTVLEKYTTALDLTAFEFFSEAALVRVTEHTGLARPFETQTPFYALLEFEQGGDQLDVAMALFEECLEAELVSDGVVSQSLSQAANLWKLREDISETLWHWKPYKNDISVKVSKMPDFILEVDALVADRYPTFEVVWYGHIGDGNLHLNILKPDDLAIEAFVEQCSTVSSEVSQLVERYQGSISAEHGVGLLKKPYLKHSKSEQEVNLMRAIRHSFDPNGILNPGKLFD